MEDLKLYKTSENKRKYIDNYISKNKDTEEYKLKRAETNKRHYNNKKKQLSDALEKLDFLKTHLL